MAHAHGQALRSSVCLSVISGCDFNVMRKSLLRLWQLAKIPRLNARLKFWNNYCLNVKTNLRNWLFIGLVLIGGSGLWRTWYSWKYPFGDRTCLALCTTSALWLYSDRNEGWYPNDGTNSLDALARLYPIYLDAAKLAGLSGDTEAVKSRLLQGKAINESISSWIYWPGFRNDDPSELAIIWDRTVGVSGIGTRSRPVGHIVGFANGKYDTVIVEKWNDFLEQQQTLRSNILSNRQILKH